MSMALTSVERINALKEGIEATTGEAYADLTAGVQALKNGYGKGGSEEFVGIQFIEASAPYGQPLKVDLRSIPQPERLFNNYCYYMFANTNANANGGLYSKLQEVFLPNWIPAFSNGMFRYCGKLESIYGDFSEVISVGSEAFSTCTNLLNIPYMPNLESIGTWAFYNCTGLTEITLPSTVTTIATNSFSGCTNLTKINCLFAEGSVAGAPWGAPNADIDIVYVTGV